MFTYICLGTNDLERAVRFYDATLVALGLQRYDGGLAGEVMGCGRCVPCGGDHPGRHKRRLSRPAAAVQSGFLRGFTAPQA